MDQEADPGFGGLLEAAPDAMVCVAADGRIAFVNAQTERLFGYGREELVGQPVELLVPEGARGVHPGHRTGTSPIRGRWARGWSWPGGAGTAARSRPRSPCPPSAPPAESSSPPPSATSPSGWNCRPTASGCGPGRNGSGWRARCTSRSGWKAWASWPAG